MSESRSREEIIGALNMWLEEKREAKRAFRESLTPEQAKLLRRVYRAINAIHKLRTLLRLVENGGEVQCSLPLLPEMRLRKLVQEAGLPPETPPEAVLEALAQLPPGEQEVLKMCYGFPQGRARSLKSIAKRLGLSIEEASKLKEKALREVRDGLRNR